MPFDYDDHAAGHADDAKIEALADYAHSAWGGWMMYLFDLSNENCDDGTYTIPKELVDRWTRQMEADYADLPENEKESDRKEARKMLALIGK